MEERNDFLSQEDVRFTVETAYSARAMSRLGRALRCTLRKKHNRISRVISWFLVVLIVILLVPVEGAPFVWDARTSLNLLVLVILLLALLFEDQINGWIAWKRRLPGTENCTTRFGETVYCNVLESGKGEFSYDRVLRLVETRDYFVMILSKNHGQLYAKSGLSGGTVDEFRAFLQEKTGQPVQKIKG